MKPYKHSLPYKGGVPRHWQCRSTEIPYLKTFKELGFDIEDEFPKGTQWTPEGEVAGDLSFEDWLRTKPDDVIEEMLGKKKADLFLNHDITLAEFLDMSGRPLTLDQLRARVEPLGSGFATRLATVAIGQPLAAAVTKKAVGIGYTKWIQGSRYPGSGYMKKAPIDTEKLRSWSSFSTNLKGLAEISAWLEETMGSTTSVYLEGAEESSAISLAKETERLSAVYPEVDIRYIETYPMGDAGVAESIYVHRKIGLNSDFFNRPRYLVEGDLVAASDLGWSVPGVESVESVMTHEFGHHLLRQIRRARNRQSAVARSIKDPLEKMFDFLNPNLGKKDLGIGEYAHEDIYELFAESFKAINWLPEEKWTPYLHEFRRALFEIIGERNIDALGYHS